MSKVLRAIRNQKKLTRINRKRVCTAYPKTSGVSEMVLKDIVHVRGEGCPLALMESNKKKFYVIATEGIAVGQKFSINDGTKLMIGNVLKLNQIPEGSSVHSVEKKLNDGGFFAKTAGCRCIIENHRNEDNQTVIKLPSGKKMVLSSDNRAIVGYPASNGIKEKPFLKAGNSFYYHRSCQKPWPKVSGVAMNPVDHNHGGGNHQHIGAPSTVSKNSCPGQRVGLVGARSTGRGRSRSGK